VRNKEKLIVVYGVRRVGKSSLVNIALREIGEPFAIIDVRALYFESGFRGVSESILVETLLGKLRESGVLYEKLRDMLSELISRIESISMGFVELRVGRRRSYLRLIDVLGLIDDWCRRNKRIFIIALDEAQYLRFSNKRYDLLLAWSIDNLSNILYVLTGSEVGLLHDFLRLDSTDSPLRGRLTAPRHSWRGFCTLWGFPHCSEPLTGAASLAQAPPPAPGRCGLIAARLAHTQHQTHY